MKNLAEVTGTGEETIRQTLQKDHPVRSFWGTECWIRLKTVDQAQELVAQLQQWAAQLAVAAKM